MVKRAARKMLRRKRLLTHFMLVEKMENHYMLSSSKRTGCFYPGDTTYTFLLMPSLPIPAMRMRMLKSMEFLSTT